MNENIQTVCIDEVAGRRIARLSGLSVTGSIGILLLRSPKIKLIPIPSVSITLAQPPLSPILRQ
ncbi:hypothetical protein NJ959_18780 [Symplocastrum sp. BBK-W-15]|uniref:Uncharacterized protein n=1 Tax=Limnofasciculus baicalensis BBK-W-15 TaxID=2699891 RepID=A0AAE3GV05_9CYAN|nr:hypothetical protein [Limnofasciculus baicalensis BBK-W-15]